MERVQGDRGRRGLLVLVALNALLGAALVIALAPGRAEAQGGGRARGQYMMVSGRMQGPSHAIYVMDVLNQELVAVRWDAAGKRLSGVGYRNVASDALNAGASR